MSERGEVGGSNARRTRRSGLRLVALLGGAVLAAVLVGELTTSDPRPTAAITPTAPGTSIKAELLRPCPAYVGGLALSETRLIGEWPVETWDCQALTEGPWSLVIRASDGHFGAKSAVVTYPVDHEGLGPAVTRPRGGRWDRNTQTLVFPMGGSHAQIVGDLGLATLVKLAMRTTDGRDGNADGRPHFLGLQGFAASAVTTFHSPVLNEIYYETRDLGLAKLGKGQIWTGVVRGASFESAAFENHAKPAGLVRGKPAMYTHGQYLTYVTPGPTTGSLTWESAPGEVTYIGFSGSASEESATEAIRTLANNGTALTPAQWRNRIPDQL